MEQIGKFRLEMKLGEGAMGEVWKAHDTELDRTVAIKFLKGTFSDEIARFKREAQTAGKLTHPNIAAVYEVGEADYRHYIAMQYIGGPTLKKFCLTNGVKQDPRDIVGLVRDAARALGFAHEQGVIHRDIKPDNLMVGADPVKPGISKMHVYVMDFGLARQMDKSNISMSGMIVGTPAYMSPEQARGDKLDKRTDIYGLGATLYELLTRHAPFHGNTLFATLKKVEEEDPKPMHGIDSDLAAIVMKCLEKDKRHRYESMLALADDLSRWLRGDAIRAHAPSITYRAKKYVKRHRNMLIASILGGVAIAAVLMGVILDKKAEADFNTAHEKAQTEQRELVKKRDEEKRRADEETKKREEETRKQKVAKLLYDAQIASTGGRHEEAMAYYNELLRLDPKSVLGRQNRAILWLHKNELAKALDDAEEAVKLDQTNAEGWCIRGAVKANMGRWADAIPDYDRAIELNPARFNFWACRGDAKCNTGDRPGAVKDIEKALEIAPRDWGHRKTYEGLLKKWKDE